MEILKYKLIEEKNGPTLMIYMNPSDVEFAGEMIHLQQQLKPTLKQEVRDILRTRFPRTRVNLVKIIVGAMVIGAFPVGEIVTKAAENQTPGMIEAITFATYKVKSGDTLYSIATTNGVSVAEIRQLNNLTGNTIFVGQTLRLPFVHYKVTPGDSLYGLANKYNSTVDTIKAKNNMKSNTIFIGQSLIIPVVTLPTTPSKQPTEHPKSPEALAPEFTSYTVVSGDTLFSIAKRFSVSVDELKTTNQLTGNTLSIGQVLKIPKLAPSPVEESPAPDPTPVEGSPSPVTENLEPVTSPVEEVRQPAPEPTPAPNETLTEYIVVPGDTLNRIAKTFNTTVNSIKQHNHLKSDMIYIGQRLLLPKAIPDPIVEKDTTPPEVTVVDYQSVIKQENVDSFQVSGTTEARAKVVLSFTDEEQNKVTKELEADENGNFSGIIDASTLEDGNIVFFVSATDRADNSNQVPSINLHKDTTGPENIEIVNLPYLNRLNQNSYTITGTTEPNSHVQLAFIGEDDSLTKSIKADDVGNFSLTVDLGALKDGEILLKTTVTDENENKGTTKENKLIKDSVVNPVTSVVLDNDGVINKQNVRQFRMSGNSDEDGGIVRIEISDGINTIVEDALVLTRTFDKRVNLASLNDGDLTVKISQTDIAGNRSDYQTFALVKDTVVNAPVVFTSKVIKTATGFNYSIVGQGEPLSIVEVVMMGQTDTREINQTVKTDENGRFEMEMNISVIGNNKPFITINQMDRLGNSSKTTVVGITSYVVGSGDSLWAIATRFNTSVDKITALNGLKSTNLSIGQELILPTVAGISSPAISEQEFFNMGYLYFGNSQSYIENVRQAENTINVVAPSYFDLHDDGSLKMTSQFDRQFIVTMQSAGVRVVPFLSNHWDRKTGENALKNRDQLSTQIAETVRIYNLDGVNIDIENVTDEYRDEYTDFVRLLREKIPEHKEVSVAVAANPNGWTKGWHGSYDYASLAKYSDYLMVMAYDESYQGSDPGPVASIDFVEKSIQYALNQGVAKEQIVVGVGHYGRYWQEGSATGGEGMSNNQIAKAVDLYNGTVTFDEVTQSAKAIFTINYGDPVMTVSGKALSPGTYTVWFENSAAIKAKIDLVHHYGVKGLGNWSLGQDNPQIWNDISAWLNTDAGEAKGI